MMLRPELFAGAIAIALTTLGCPEDEPGRADADTAVADTGDAADSVETADVGETSAPDTVSDTGDTATDTGADTAIDTIDDDASDAGADVVPGDVTAAVPGERCTLAERVGLVEIEEISTEPPTFYAFGAVEDRPNPWLGAPERSTDACDFHRFDPTSACPPCASDELCGTDGACDKAPVRHLDAALVLHNDAGEMRIEADPVTGDIWGQVNVAGRAFAVDLSFAGHRVTLATTESPGTLDSASGTLDGGYEAPERLELAWSTTATGSHVYTRIPINHHAAGPTFTECTVPASVGAMSIDEDMLAPLAIITGLEFQGIEHVRFAAAHTPLGCVELRFIVRHYVSF